MLRLALITVSLLAGAAQAQDLDALKADTRKNALPVLPKVVGMMQETVAAKGPVEAIPVCKDKAPQLLREQATKTGWGMRRVSLQTRNPERGTPDVWEARQLADFNIRAAAGEKVETLGTGELVTEELIAESIACGPDLDLHLERAQAYADAGVDELYVQQIGDGRSAAVAGEPAAQGALHRAGGRGEGEGGGAAAPGIPPATAGGG